MNELEIVDGLSLSEKYRSLLRPNESLGEHSLPRFFYAVPSWEEAHQIRVAEHFKLAELMTVDCGEAELLLQTFPHYVPCAIGLLAGFLEGFRRAADAPVFISANGGYRSPAHRRNEKKSAHCWGTAADIYRVGDTYLDNERSIAKYAEIARSLGVQLFVRPYVEGDDHLHIDLGFINVTPRDWVEE